MQYTDLLSNQIALEAIGISSFIRKFTIYNTSHLKDKIINMGSLEFPIGSVFHIYDNIADNISADSLAVSGYKFVEKLPTKPTITNVADYTSPIKELRVRYPLSLHMDIYNKSKQLLKTFGYFKPFGIFKQTKETKYVIVNYNPLSLIVPIVNDGAMFFKSTIILHTIISMLQKFNLPYKFIMFPVASSIQFTTVRKLIELTSVSYLKFDKLFDSFSTYALYMLVFNLIDKAPVVKYRRQDVTNPFDLLDRNDNDTFIIFTDLQKTQCVIVSHKTLKNLVNNNIQKLATFLDLLNQLVKKESHITTSSLTLGLVSQETQQTEKIASLLPNEPKVNEPFTFEETLETAEEAIKPNPLLEQERTSAQKTTIVDTIQSQLDNLIQNESLTPKQQARIKNLFNRAFNLKIETEFGPTTIQEEITKNSNLPVTSESIEPAEKHLLDKSLAKSNIFQIEKQYYKNVFYKDLLSCLLNFAANGLFLVDYKEENEYNTFNRIKHITVKFEDINGKRHTVKFKLPVIDDNGTILFNGIQYYIRKQLVNLPICKVSPVRVSLASNFNKTLIERKPHLGKDYLKSMSSAIQSLADTNSLSYKTGSKVYIDAKLPLDYTQLAQYYEHIINEKYSFYFDQDVIFTYFGINDTTKQKIRDYCDNGNFTFIGMTKDKKNFLFMHNRTNIVHEIVNFNTKSPKVVNRGFLSKFILLDYEQDVYKTPIEYCYLKILDKAFPIIFVLGFKHGLTNILKRLKIKYRLVTTKSRLNIQPNEIAIKFKDFTLIFNRYPLFNSLLLAGLAYFDLSKYNFGDLDNQDTYFQLLNDKGISINYLKGIDNFFNFFIDPITYDILKQMGEPTTPTGLLLRGIELLCDDYFKEPSSITNFRLRTLERVPSIVYNEIARQYAQYLNDKKRDATFSINTEAIFMRIMQDNSVVIYEDLNPIHDVKLKSLGTYLGFGGRTEESFVEVDRKYPNDGIGIFSEATPDSGKVAVNFNFPPNTVITNIRGFVNPLKDKSSAESSQVFSVTGLLFPGIHTDDPKRANFANVQSTHVIPTKGYEIGRVRTGYELVMPYLVNDRFCITAEDNGTIIDVNSKLKLFKVKYNDGRIVTYDYNDRISYAQGKYVYQKLTITDKVTKSKKIKKYDILAYAPEFFDYDPYTSSLAYKTGTYVNVAFMESDLGLEDSSAITPALVEKLSYNATHLRQILLTSDMVILGHKNIGDEVTYDTPLLYLSYRDIEQLDIKNIDDSESATIQDILADFQTLKAKANYNGTITQIKVFYTCDKSTMDPSIQKFINKIETVEKAKQQYAKDSSNNYLFTYTGKVEPGTRIKKKELNEDNILIQYYITHEDQMFVGDKLVLANQLKSVVGKVIDPVYTEDGKIIHLLFGSKSLDARIVLSAIKVGIIERILEKLEEDIGAMI